MQLGQLPLCVVTLLLDTHGAVVEGSSLGKHVKFPEACIIRHNHGTKVLCFLDPGMMLAWQVLSWHLLLSNMC